MKKITIAIDGYSSCGKSTMAKDLAREIGYIYIDSGAMYRAVTLYSLQKGFFSEKGIDTEALKTAMPDIHISFRLNPETQRPMTFLNEALVKQQQEMGKAKGIVMDGRDIGTVVFPDAELKIFVTASAAIRAQRRYDELRSKGQEASYEKILENVEERDRIDQTREVGPLRQADDAILLDNSHMSIAEQKEWLTEKFQAAING